MVAPRIAQPLSPKHVPFALLSCSYAPKLTNFLVFNLAVIQWLLWLCDLSYTLLIPLLILDSSPPLFLQQGHVNMCVRLESMGGWWVEAMTPGSRMYPPVAHPPPTKPLHSIHQRALLWWPHASKLASVLPRNKIVKTHLKHAQVNEAITCALQFA